MFGRFDRLINNINTLDESIILFKIVSRDDVQQFALTLNAFEQIYKEGIRADGSNIVASSTGNSGYSLVTQEEYGNLDRTFDLGGVSKKKIAGDSYFLVDSGDFFASFEIKVEDDGFIISADTEKPDVDMLEEYGDILGLTDENKQKFIQEILPMVRSDVYSILLS